MIWIHLSNPIDKNRDKQTENERQHNDNNDNNSNNSKIVLRLL